MRSSFTAALMLATALALVSGCSSNAVDEGSTASAAELTTLPVPAGAQIKVRLTSNLTSETAQVGDPWSGTLSAALTVGDREIIPAGTPVRGAVTGAHPAGLGTRAMLDLVVQDVSIAGATQKLSAGTDAILADLPTSPPSTSGAKASDAADPVTPAAKGAEVVLSAGTELTFTVREGAPAQ